MNRRFLQWLVAPALVTGLVAAGVAGAGASVEHAKKLSATLNGSGSTFQLAYDQAAIQAFTAKNSDVTINYAGGGSGKGRQDFSDQVVDFAGTDAAYPSADAAKVKGGEFFYIPTVVAPITVSYNLSGVKKLQLSASTIAKIFQLTITKWNDPAIAADNPKATLPSTNDHGGPPLRQLGHDQQLHDLPDEGGTGRLEARRQLDDQLAVRHPGRDRQRRRRDTSSRRTDGAIGYVDFSDAKAIGLTFAAVKNQSLKFVAPSLKSAALAASGDGDPREPALRPDLRTRADGLPDHLADVDPGLQDPVGRVEGRRAQGVPDLHPQQGGPEARLDRQLRTVAGGPREAGAGRREADRLIAG